MKLGEPNVQFENPPKMQMQSMVLSNVNSISSDE